MFGTARGAGDTAAADIVRGRVVCASLAPSLSTHRAARVRRRAPPVPQLAASAGLAAHPAAGGLAYGRSLAAARRRGQRGPRATAAGVTRPAEGRGAWRGGAGPPH